MTSELFRHLPEETLTRIPNRPLGRFSDFVVAELPASLTAIRKGRSDYSNLNELSHELIEGLTPDVMATATATQDNADLALLDLLIMDNALVRTTGPNPKLTALDDSLAAANDRPPIITYEDVVLTNPLYTDCRLHTNEEIGLSERDFYIAHREIEGDLDVLIDTSKEVIYILKQDDLNTIGNVAEMLHTAGLRWVDINARMELLWKAMPKEHFITIRDYFLSHPIRTTPDGEKYKGPSGAFTAKIPVFEILFAGETMKPEQFHYFKDNEMYFPRKGREEIQDALQYLEEGSTLTQLASLLGNPPILKTELDQFDHYLNQFRGMHYAGIKHQIPGAVEGNVSGSAGEVKVGQFLKGRMIKHTS